MDSATLRGRPPARMQRLAPVTEARTFELADGIASGMPTGGSDIPIRVNPCIRESYAGRMVRSAPAACRGKARDWSRIAHMVNEVPARRSQMSRARAVSSRDWWAWRGRHPGRLRQVAFVGFPRVRDMPSQLAGPCARGPAGDAQQEGGRACFPPVYPRTQGSSSRSSFRAGADGRFSRLAVVRRSPHHHGRLAHQAGDLQRLAEHAVQLSSAPFGSGGALCRAVLCRWRGAAPGGPTAAQPRRPRRCD